MEMSNKFASSKREEERKKGRRGEMHCIYNRELEHFTAVKQL
jgi:hypothetical protein